MHQEELDLSNGDQDSVEDSEELEGPLDTDVVEAEAEYEDDPVEHKTEQVGETAGDGLTDDTTEVQSVEDSASESNKGRRSLWSQTIDNLPNLITTSKGPGVRLLQAALNYTGESYLELDGKMSPTVKGAARRIKNEAGCEHTDRYCDVEVWHYLLGNNPPEVSTDGRTFHRGTLLLQSLLYINGYQIHPSGYWNDQTQRCFEQFCQKNGFNNKLSPTVWSSLLDIG